MRLGDDRSPFRRSMVGGAGVRVVWPRTDTPPRSLAHCQCGFWLGGRFPNSPPAATERAAYERSDLDLTLAGRGSPLTPFPNSLPLRPPLSLSLSPGPFYSPYYIQSVWASLWVEGKEGLMDQT